MSSGAKWHEFWVPEVIILPSRLEHWARKGQAVAMWEFLKKCFTPMNVAAYIAWLAIGLEFWFDSIKSTGLIPADMLVATTITLHGAYLICFILCTLIQKNKPVRQILALAMVLTALLICLVSRFSSAPILLIVASAVLATLFSPSRLIGLFITSNVCFYFIYRNLWHEDRPAMAVLIYSSFQLFAMLMAWYSHQADKRRDELVLLNADLIATRSLLAETVRDSERLRLSRELHDVAGHKLTALKLNLTALVRQPELAKYTGIETCAELADELLADIRGVVQQMRLHDGMDLQVAIEKMAAPFPRPQLLLAIDEHAHHVPMLQAEVLLRTVQEALTNTARHSQAQQLWVVLLRDNVQWLLRIRDDGRMASNWQKGNGLQGMTERLENLGGGLRCEHSNTGGMQIEAWLPVLA
jgi:signal transduction histidine kinase